MAKTITEQIEDLEKENESLQKLKKAVERLTKEAFGMTPDDITKMIKGNDPEAKHFVEKLRKYFHLETSDDLHDFLAVMCSESSRNFFENHRKKNEASAVTGTNYQAETP